METILAILLILSIFTICNLIIFMLWKDRKNDNKEDEEVEDEKIKVIDIDGEFEVDCCSSLEGYKAMMRDDKFWRKQLRDVWSPILEKELKETRKEEKMKQDNLVDLEARKNIRDLEDMIDDLSKRIGRLETKKITIDMTALESMSCCAYQLNDVKKKAYEASLLTNKEKLLVAGLLRIAKNIFVNHGCSDVPDSLFEGWDEDEVEKLFDELRSAGYGDYNDIVQLEDWELMDFFARKLKVLAEKTT